jgi:CDGSH-type Zn-finger protein
MDTDNLFPIAVEVEEDKIYYWCSCGQSKTQPFCDNRAVCADKVVPYQATLNETLYFCACKQTKSPPFCDGSHAKLLMEMMKKK